MTGHNTVVARDLLRSVMAMRTWEAVPGVMRQIVETACQLIEKDIAAAGEPAATVPPAAQAWIEAEIAHLAAGHAYSAGHALPGGEALRAKQLEASNAAHALIPPMYRALHAAAKKEDGHG